ncbi:S41 family peptidase [Lacticaseibacillus brantae]|nr:S41 family peptidase [Lacticaseibacillus brantae]
MTKIQVPLWLTSTAVVVALATGGVVGYAITSPQQSSDPNINKIVSTYEAINDGYYQKPDAKKLVNGAINGMVSSLDDPYSNLLQTDDKTSLDTTISASFGGIGAVLKNDQSKLLIDSVTADGAAKKAGLKPNDELVAINGKSTTGWSTSEAVAKIRGKVGTTVSVTIKRAGVNQTFKVKRQKITTETVAGTMDTKDKALGIIQISSFSEPTTDQLKATIKQLRKAGAKRFILDLRGNPGGLMPQALSIASMFLKNGQKIMTVEPRNGDSVTYRAGKDYDDGFKVTEPTAVLIDGQSASAAEITAAALNENRNILLIGEKSFGKGTVQNVNSLNETSELKLTVAKWLTPKGQWINHKGLMPTDKVPYPAAAKITMVTKASLKLGDTGTDVRSLQQMLAALKFNPGAVNGDYNETTASAVKAFQATNQLPTTGSADAQTLQILTTKLANQLHQDDPMINKARTVLSKESN